MSATASLISATDRLTSVGPCESKVAGALGADAPLVTVVDPNGGLARWVAGMCDALRMRIRLAADAISLSAALEQRPPIALICGDLNGEEREVTRLLKLVSCYDPDLPVLLLTDDRPELLGRIDTALALWRLHDIQHFTVPPRPETIMAFLAHAGRRRGGLRMMTI